jgi:hypothetical protein
MVKFEDHPIGFTAEGADVVAHYLHDVLRGSESTTRINSSVPLEVRESI